MISERFRLVSQDFQKVGRGALIAGVGAAGTYLFEALPGVDFGEYTPLVVAVVSVLANLFRKWLSKNQYQV